MYIVSIIPLKVLISTAINRMCVCGGGLVQSYYSKQLSGDKKRCHLICLQILSDSPTCIYFIVTCFIFIPDIQDYTEIRMTIGAVWTSNSTIISLFTLFYDII